MLLFIVFLGSSILTFAIVAVVTKPTPEQKAIGKRIVGLKAASPGMSHHGEQLQMLLKKDRSGSFEWLGELIEQYQFSQKLALYISQAQVNTTTGALAFTCVASAFAAFAATYFVVPVLGLQVALGIAAGYVPIAVLGIKRSKRTAAFNAVLPESIDMMARSLRAGHSMVAAIGIIAEQAPEPAASEFGEVFQQQNFGLPLRDALMQLLDRVPSPDLRVVVTGILVQKDTGGNLAEILDRIVYVVRERLRIQGEIKTQTAQGRMTGWILCLLPVVLLVLINVINPGYSRPLTDTELGHKVILAGVVLMAIGAFAIRSIVNGIEL
jgi:tight adherence protein B